MQVRTPPGHLQGKNRRIGHKRIKYMQRGKQAGTQGGGKRYPGRTTTECNKTTRQKWKQTQQRRKSNREPYYNYKKLSD